MSSNLIDLGNGWQGRGTETTRVAFHEDGSTIVFQGGVLIADATGVTPTVVAFLFRHTITGTENKES